MKLLGKYPNCCKSILSLDSRYCHIITFQLFRSKLVSESKQKDCMPWWNWSSIIQFHSGRSATFPLKMVDDIDGSRTNINGKSKFNVLAKMHLWNKLEYCDCRAAIQKRFIHIVASEILIAIVGSVIFSKSILVRDYKSNTQFEYRCGRSLVSGVLILNISEIRRDKFTDEIRVLRRR